MANLKSLFKDTAIYGVSSIVGRFLNWLLVPLYTTKFAASSGEYGVVTNVYAYTALFLVLLTFGMETTFFRFANKEGEDAGRVYSTTLVAVGCVALAFLLAVLAFLPGIAGGMGYADTPQYVAVMAIVVALDAFQCIPFAYLRYLHRPVKFAALKLTFIGLSIALNLVCFLLLPALDSSFRPDVGYVFYINLLCTVLITFGFRKELTGVRWTLDAALLRRMLAYAWPILILGIAGILNQTADKIIYPLVRTGEAGRMELGIYGAAAKIAMIMALITQAFRYAYEPFVFGKSREQDNRDTYAQAMKFFVIFTFLAFLCVVGYLDILKYVIGRDYWEGLRVVPVIMVAEIMMGIYFNLSFWYKLTDRTIWGAVFSGIGCAVLIAFNILLIPVLHYEACAWAGVAGYGTAMVLSYCVGQHYYPIRYPLRSIAVYVAIAGLFYVVMQLVPSEWPLWARLGVNTALVLAFAGHIVCHDMPLSQLPLIGKHFRK